MDINQKRFVDDTLDLLNELDEGLMQLESNPYATAPLEQVFRTMHTIKGGANMFGFENIGELSYRLENIFDLVRQGKLHITDNLISITLRAFDKVRDLLKENDIRKVTNADALSEHLKNASEFLQEAEVNSHQHNGSLAGVIQKTRLVTFFIRISPRVNITADGQHPLVYIIKDLEALGTSSTFLYNENKYIKHWDVYLATTTSQSELESHFLFVEEECVHDFQLLLATDLFKLEEFKNYIQQYSEKPVEKTDLVSFVNKIKSIVNEDVTFGDEGAKGNLLSQRTHPDSSIKVNKHKIDNLSDCISSLISIRAQLKTQADRIQSTDLSITAAQLEKITDKLCHAYLEIGLVPIETWVIKIKRLVRELSKSLEKKINFVSDLANTEMDRNVIEILEEPIMYIIRNSVDRGIEKPATRITNGKSEYATIKLKAFSAGAHINIIISDDGKGIDKDKLLQKAIDKGLVSSKTILTDEEVLMLIFDFRLSTNDAGMSEALQKITNLHGHVTVKSQLGKGTSLQIKLPLKR